MLLVYGWYGRENIGDELMKLALQRLFEPTGIELKFVDHITFADLQTTQGVIFGGGSILNDAPDVTPDALDLLLTTAVPVFYVGVGIDYTPHPTHASLLRIARVIARRTQPDAPGRIIPDLVYSLTHSIGDVSADGILIVPNVEVLPTSAMPNWSQLSWLRYVDELSQVLDHLDEKRYQIKFLTMCKNPRQDDNWVTSAIVSHMVRRRTTFEILQPKADIDSLITIFKQARCIVTQRYHGIVLAEMAGVPYVSIDHHDKLGQAIPRNGEHISYHGVTKSQLVNSIEKAYASSIPPYVPDQSLYHRVVDEIVYVINER